MELYGDRSKDELLEYPFISKKHECPGSEQLMSQTCHDVSITALAKTPRDANRGSGDRGLGCDRVARAESHSLVRESITN